MLAVSLLFAALAMASVCSPAAAQQSRATFLEQTMLGDTMWSEREKASVEWITRSSGIQFRDGNTGQRTATLSNYFLLYGGETTNTGWGNDVWVSSNGRAWSWVGGYADEQPHPNNPDTFPPWVEAAQCQDTQFRQFRVGGRSGGQVMNDVWMSANGYQWDEVTYAGEFEPVYLASLTADTNNNLYLAGGILDDGGNPRRASGAVYMSTNQGKRWLPMSNWVNDEGRPSGPGARGVSILLSPAPNQLMWMTGVDTTTYTNELISYRADVWASSDSGKSFSPMNRNSLFGRRDDAGAEINTNGIAVLAGGYRGTSAVTGDGEILNDVWASANGGYTWGLCVEDAEWDDRRYQMTVLDSQGYFWVMGGRSATQRYNDVWKSVWSFSNADQVAARCGLTIPGCGAGLKCLPGSGNTFVNTNVTAVYCDACPNPASSTTAATNTLTIALAVVAIAAALFLLGLLYSCSKLRSAGIASPIPLPASAQQWWNNSGGSGGDSTGAAAGGAPVNGGGNTATNGDGLYQPLRIRDQI